MKKIVVASNNPVKIRAAENGFARMFPEGEFQVVSQKVDSTVAVQPMGDQETLLGARQRAEHARQALPDADYWVGIEGGTQEMDSDLATFAWVVVLSRELSGRGRSAAFFLPPNVAALVRQGMELGPADDVVFGRTNSKQANGAIGILTGDVVDRAALYEQAVIMALVPFKNEALYSGGYSDSREEFTISTDTTRLDIDTIHDFLSNRAYWAKGRSRQKTEHAIHNSLCFGVYQGSQQVGFARVVTDRATFAYLADVFILEEFRGRGLGKWLVETILRHPELQNLRLWCLRTADAHELYSRYGFTPLQAPQRWMERFDPQAYSAG